MVNQIILLMLLLTSLCIKQCLSYSQVMSDTCESKEKCTDCMQKLGCTWCSVPLDASSHRCRESSDFRNFTREEWCTLGNPVVFVEQDEKFGKSNGRTVQIKPQLVNLTLQMDEPYELTFQYKRAKDYPVDLYYLMDLSESMVDDKDNLANLGGKLAETMRNITKNFRIGFGSFVDKTVIPFVSTAPKKKNNPCRYRNCTAPYSFKNEMPLNSNHTLFSMRVREAKISGNLDSPEGGFDALMQAIVCSKEIGWRPEAQHLLVLATDASFHLAGDGKLAGIILPNDEQCHLVKNEYKNTTSLKYDYPSISQLNRKALENNINIIFATTSRHRNLYQQLQKRINASSWALLKNDSSNIIALIQEKYLILRGSVALVYADVDGVEVQFNSTCSEQSTNYTECRNLKFHDVVNFTATIRVNKCPGPKFLGKPIPLEIKLMAMNESLKVNVEVLSSCSHEIETFEVNSTKCSGVGNFSCGICTCDSQYIGYNCECLRDANDSASDTVGYAKKARCIHNDAICSNSGVCKCGVCHCNQRNSSAEKIYGKFCECDNYSCDRKGSLMCSGQGECECGKCVCNDKWAGTACDCSTSTKECTQVAEDGTEVICSNQGTCVCGACKCKVTENESYSGKYCGECLTCPVDQLCQELKFCVDCQAYNAKHQECQKCLELNITKIDTLREGQDMDSSDGEYKCLVLIEDCSLEFIYKYAEGSLAYIEALLEKDCAKRANIIAYILGGTGGTMILGLLILLIWKLLTSIYDRREYVKFKRERTLAKWGRGDNPLYKPSLQTFYNPTFGKTEQT